MKPINIITVVIKPKWYEIYKRVIYKDIRHIKFLSKNCYSKYEQLQFYLFNNISHTYHALTFKPIDLGSFFERT